MSPLALLLAACLAPQESPAAASSAPVRMRLFDLMDRARIEGAPAPAAAEAEGGTTRRELRFDGEPVPRIWTGMRSRWQVSWDDDSSGFATVVGSGGVSGGALQLGPGRADDRSFAALVFEAKPLARYVVRGRVRLVDHPAADAASAREIVQIAEHAAPVDDPTRAGDSVLDVHRGSRRRDPTAVGGWERFEVEIPLTFGATRALELRLLHRNGGAAPATTFFDDVVLEETRMTEAQTWKLLLEHHRPQDGRAEATSWRLRVTLPTEDRIKDETRDCVLLAPPRRLSIPLTLPAADARPQLRFSYSMLPESFGAPGDGAQLAVSFEPDGAAPVELAKLELDPKNDRRQRCWRTARVDLAPVAGRAGRLVFASSDLNEPDPLDAVVIATPRIEPLAPPLPLAEGSAAGAGPMNVLVIASDTLRADRLSAFGYERPTSPCLARLAEHGVRFTRTRSQAPWTLPSFSSIMTSMYPSEHGAGRGGHDEWTPLDPGAVTLADVLAAAGWETAGITANHLISPEYGLDQGFESYAIPGEEEWRRIGMESVELDAPLVVRFLEQHRSTPFFLFWHIMDPHLPYTTPAELRAQFTESGYDGRFRGDDPRVPFEVLDPRPGRRWFTHEGPPKPPPLSDADRKFVSDYYDAEIAQIDAAIGQALDALRRTGLWDRTIVAMIADHGEGLGEHGHYHHGYTLFEDQVHIPMIVRVPGGAEGRAIDAPAASIDLAPTLLSALGLDAPPSFRGRDRLMEIVARELPSDAAGDEEPIFLEYPSYDSSAQKGVILGDWKYLHDPWFHTQALYDTRSDPLERDDVAAAHPEIVERGRALLDEFRWQRLQQGRFHVRVAGRKGAKLRLALATDDLFDANFATRPQVDERDFALDLDRRRLVLETTMEGDKLELVCWCRGDSLVLEATLDGEPIGGGIRVGAAEPRPSPLVIEREAVAVVSGETLPPPKPMQAVWWMEPGAGNVAPVVPTPEQAEMLRALGYAH
jgi:arylsulfatase A-like enzyme